MSNLRKRYLEEIAPRLMKKMGYKSIMEVPRIEKVTLNIGVGGTVGNKKVMEYAMSDLAKISGQKPIITKAKKSIAGFKILSLIHI